MKRTKNGKKMMTFLRTGSIIALLGVMIMVLSACGTSGSGNGSEDGSAATGGWVISDQNGTKELSGDVKKAFDEATEKYTGSELVPLAVIYEQVVAGMNYQILCRSTATTQAAEPELKIVEIYANVNGGAKVEEVADLYIADYAGGAVNTVNEESTASDSPSGNVSGGWSVPEKRAACELPDDASSQFESAVKDSDGNDPEPMAYLGERTNEDVTEHAILCAGTSSAEDAVTMAEIVIVGEDENGKAAITHVGVIDPDLETWSENEDMKETERK